MTAIAKDVVSSEGEELILVDLDDNRVGTLSKAHCHDGDGVLHRAFSLFIFNPHGELLMQQRGAAKRLWPLYWSNSCCSHPRDSESMGEATRRRLREELGIESSLEFVYKFTYHARFGELGSENEFCSVFLGRVDEAVDANQNEIAGVRYVGAAELTTALQDESAQYTPWLQMEWRRLQEEFAEQLGKYTTATNDC